jgi:hypothetical protein
MMSITASQRILLSQDFLLSLYERLAHIPRGLQAIFAGNVARISARLHPVGRHRRTAP